MNLPHIRQLTSPKFEIFNFRKFSFTRTSARFPCLRTGFLFQNCVPMIAFKLAKFLGDPSRPTWWSGQYTWTQWNAEIMQYDWFKIVTWLVWTNQSALIQFSIAHYVKISLWHRVLTWDCPKVELLRLEWKKIRCLFLTQEKSTNTFFFLFLLLTLSLNPVLFFIFYL